MRAEVAFVPGRPRSGMLAFAAAAAVLLDLGGGGTAARAAVTISVNDAGDGDNAADDKLTLREALRVANGERAAGPSEAALVTGGAPGPGVDEVIVFVAPAFGGGTAEISIGSELPPLSGDRTTVNAGGKVRLAATGTVECGLRITGNSNAVSGLEITGFGTGVCIDGASDTLVSGCTVQGNGGAGVHVAGGARVVVVSVTARQNGGGGIRFEGAVDSIADGCTVTGNSGTGILVDGAGSGATLTGNRVGITAAGALAPNTTDGIRVGGGSGAIVGGTNLGNTVRGNGGYGIAVAGGSGTQVGPDNVAGENGASGIYVGAAAGAVKVVGNRVGLGPGDENLHNHDDGILLAGAANAVVAANDVRNQTGGCGIRATNSATGNRIGRVDSFAGNTARGNSSGICFESGATQNQAGPENVVVANGVDGVSVLGPAARNTISLDSITGHPPAGKAIHLISGGNQSLPSPAITSATATSVAGVGPDGARIELFADPADEAASFLGSTDAADGVWTVTGIAVPSTGFLTASATDALGNTSELSAPFAAPAPPPDAGVDATPGDGADLAPADAAPDAAPADAADGGAVAGEAGEPSATDAPADAPADALTDALPQDNAAERADAAADAGAGAADSGCGCRTGGQRAPAPMPVCLALLLAGAVAARRRGGPSRPRTSREVGAVQSTESQGGP